MYLFDNSSPIGNLHSRLFVRSLLSLVRTTPRQLFPTEGRGAIKSTTLFEAPYDSFYDDDL